MSGHHLQRQCKVCEACGWIRPCPPLTDCTTHGFCERCGSHQVRYRRSWGMLADQLERLWIVIKRS